MQKYLSQVASYIVQIYRGASCGTCTKHLTDSHTVSHTTTIVILPDPTDHFFMYDNRRMLLVLLSVVLGQGHPPSRLANGGECNFYRFRMIFGQRGSVH